MKVLFASSEIYPYSKSGGLGDVAHSLPLALKKRCRMVSITPLYRFIDRKKFNLHSLGTTYTLQIAEKTYTYELFQAKGSDTLFVYNDILCETEALYGYDNDALRFGLFSYMIAAVAERINADIVHLNDWHTALAALLLKPAAIKTVFSIHNLAYQGIFNKKTLRKLAIDKRYFTMEGLEFYGKVNFLKAGIAYSNIITTVSPTYAKEILTDQFGCGLDGFLKKHEARLKGILNGIDTLFFNPEKDRTIGVNFDAVHLEKKAENKRQYYRTLGIEENDKPLFIFIGRLVEQKGISVMMEMLKNLSKELLEFVILGEGEKETEKKLLKLSKKYQNIHYIQGYDEALSHQLYASADFLLMPSLFEPCGLNQMIAARYGTVPIVHSTGGLKDSVFEQIEKCIQGIVFDDFSKEGCLGAVMRALVLYRNKKTYQSMVKFDMECDVSFKRSAKAYMKIYRELL
ncbi:MAG: hypothetical protein P794_07220 [Epsilonproteobacteria bacterium (ex Lamellibrachia satsuma)]|nr:MAG: hypothetical protein P794_07220 [Epsilonproteobacteria bacterium (ex Lamellibrachia satsuma)]